MSDPKSVSEELRDDIEQAGLSDEDLDGVAGGGTTIITSKTIIVN